MVALRPVSARGIALGATAPVVPKTYAVQDTEAARKRAAKNTLQAAQDPKAAASISREARVVVKAVVHQGSPEFQARKRSLCERAERARAAAGDVVRRTPVPGLVVELASRRKRQR